MGVVTSSAFSIDYQVLAYFHESLSSLSSLRLSFFYELVQQISIRCLLFERMIWKLLSVTVMTASLFPPLNYTSNNQCWKVIPLTQVKNSGSHSANVTTLRDCHIFHSIIPGFYWVTLLTNVNASTCLFSYPFITVGDSVYMIYI